MLDQLLRRLGYHRVDWFVSMGRYHLKVNGYVVASQTDDCRDPDLMDDLKADEARETYSRTTWDKKMLGQVLMRDLDKHP